MQRVTLRDVLVTTLFGVSAPWLWVFLLGIAATLRIPVLLALLHVAAPSKPFMSWYSVAFDVIAALIYAAAIALPLGYFLRRKPMWAWLQFVLLFWAALALSALLSGEAFDLSFIATDRSVWLFLAASGLFIMIGHKLRRQHAEA